MVGKRDSLELVLAGILAGGHVLLEDLPGLGKTLTARSFAQALGLEFRRLQFTPDLLPADVTGSFLYDQRKGDFAFRAGPVFTNLLLADEINRTPPKTQAALLEAMQEKQVSVEGVTYRLEPPFHVLATANPIEYEGTYPLPEAQLDRFLLRVSFGYPTADEEWDVLQPPDGPPPGGVVPAAGRRRAYAAGDAGGAGDVAVEDSIGRYIVELAAATREHAQVLVGASPRGSLALLLLARARAALAGRDYVVPEDVKDVAVPALAHRHHAAAGDVAAPGRPGVRRYEVLAATPAPASGASAHLRGTGVPVRSAASGRHAAPARRPLAGRRVGRADAWSVPGLGADPGARAVRAAQRPAAGARGDAGPGRSGGAGRAVRDRRRGRAAPDAARRCPS